MMSYFKSLVIVLKMLNEQVNLYLCKINFIYFFIYKFKGIINQKIDNEHFDELKINLERYYNCVPVFLKKDNLL